MARGRAMPGPGLARFPGRGLCLGQIGSCLCGLPRRTGPVDSLLATQTIGATIRFTFSPTKSFRPSPLPPPPLACPPPQAHLPVRLQSHMGPHRPNPARTRTQYRPQVLLLHHRSGSSILSTPDLLTEAMLSHLAFPDGTAASSPSALPSSPPDPLAPQNPSWCRSRGDRLIRAWGCC